VSELLIFALPNQKQILQEQAKVAHLVEHNLAKVGVAGSSPVFRSKNDPAFLRDFFSGAALVVELVDTQDLKSCSPQTRVRVQVPPGALARKRLFNY
jgi:hypothetical protein